MQTFLCGLWMFYDLNFIFRLILITFISILNWVIFEYHRYFHSRSESKGHKFSEFACFLYKALFYFIFFNQAQFLYSRCKWLIFALYWWGFCDQYQQAANLIHKFLLNLVLINVPCSQGFLPPEPFLSSILCDFIGRRYTGNWFKGPSYEYYWSQKVWLW